MNDADSIRCIPLKIAIALQVLMLLVLNLFDYAYMFPSQSGLTLDHFFLFCLIYGVAFIVGIFIAISQRKLPYAGLQIGIPICCVLLLYVASFFAPRNHVLVPSDFQHLVGKARGEVEPLLYKYGTHGYSRGIDGPEIETVHYNGIDLRYERVRLKNQYDESGDILREIVKVRTK